MQQRGQEDKTKCLAWACTISLYNYIKRIVRQMLVTHQGRWEARAIEVGGKLKKYLNNQALRLSRMNPI